MAEYLNFTQTVTFESDDVDEILRLAADWDRQQATLDVMGYIGMRVLADRSNPGRYVLIADFGVVDPDVSAAEEAAKNNDRPETQAANARVVAIAKGEIQYHDYDEIYRTDPLASSNERQNRTFI
jgi:hypothetical protein